MSLGTSSSRCARENATMTSITSRAARLAARRRPHFKDHHYSSRSWYRTHVSEGLRRPVDRYGRIEKNSISPRKELTVIRA